jgi:hypothetical protein
MDKQITVKFSGGREGKRSPGIKEGTMRRGRGQDLIEEGTTSY